jgi:putative peptidoglycan lipid II flippase
VLAGFLVNATMAALFGAGERTDAFFVASTIPFAIASILLASANQVLVPLINGWFNDEGPEVAERLVGRLLGTTVTAAAAVAVVGIATSPILPRLIAPGSTARTKEQAVAISVLLFITVVTRIAAEIFRALLNARFSFVAPAAMPLVENLTVLAVMLLLGRRIGVQGVAVGYVVGGFLQMGFMVGMARLRGLRIRPLLGFRDPEIVRAFGLMLLPLTATGLNMVARATERFLASFLPPGSITILNYGWLIVNSLGGAIFFRSVVVAILPRLAEAKHDRAASARLVGEGLRIMGVLSFALTALVIVLAGPLVSFAFQRGAFTGAAAGLLAGVLAVYSLQFPLDALTRVLLAHSFARLDVRTPFINGALGVGINIVLAIVLRGPLGITGLALAYVLASVGNLVHAYVTLRRHLRLDLRRVGDMLARAAVSAAAAGAVAALILRATPEPSGFLGRGLRLGLPGLGGLVMLVLTLLALRVRLIRSLVARPPGEQ